MLELFKSKNLSTKGYISFYPTPPYTIYFIVKECDGYTHQIVYDPLIKFDRGMSGDNKTIYRKGLNYGFIYMIDYFDDSYRKEFIQRN